MAEKKGRATALRAGHWWETKGPTAILAPLLLASMWDQATDVPLGNSSFMRAEQGPLTDACAG